MSGASKICVVNAGNSNVQFAIWDGSAVSGLKTAPSASFSASSIPKGTPCAAASVVPEIERELSLAGAFILNPCVRTGLDLSGMDASTIGADRLANAIALAATGPLPAVCVDCGTAITFEFVDKNRRLLGGAIMPGRMLLRKALKDFTAKLPLVGMEEETPKVPGLNTVDAIRAGVDVGSLGAVREILSRLEAFCQGEPLKKLACGGDAEYFISNIDGLVRAGADFTLRGVAKAWELNSK